MLPRLLLLLLVLLNLGVGGWLVFGQATPVPPPLTDPGVPQLQLLGSNSGHTPRRAASTAGTAVKASGKCLRIGPFADRASMHDAVVALEPKVAQLQTQQDDTARQTDWWVYLPAFQTRQQALVAARQLAAQGVSDYYVISGGDQQNTVSLGLFHNEDNARQRFAAVAQLGFHPQIAQRNELVPQYWIDIVLPAQPGFDWRNYVSTLLVNGEPTACF